MPIQTSSITTSTNGDLTLDPNGAGKLVLTDNASGSTKQVAVDASGNVENLDVTTLPLASEVSDSDLIVIQAGSTQGGLTVGNLYRADAGNLSPTFNRVDPSPSDVTATPPFLGGDGTAASPYIITPAVVSTSGGTAESIQLITITSATGGVVHMEDISDGDAFGKFQQKNGVIDPIGGTYQFRLDYSDIPATPAGEGNVYKGLIKLGDTTVYFTWTVAQVSNASSFSPISAPNASPKTVSYAGDGKYGTVSATWKDGPLTLSNPDGNLEFSINNGVQDSTNKTVTDGDTVKLSFKASIVTAAAEGATIAGVLKSTDNSYLSAASIVKDITPGPFTFSAQSNAQISAVATSALIALGNINAPTTVTGAVGGTNAMTSIQVSVNGAAFTSTYPITYNPGDTIQVRGTTGSVAATAYSAVVTVGGVSSTFTATTGAVAASLVTPNIVSPGNFDGTEQAEDVSVTSSTCARVDGGAVTHQSSTWEAYKALAGAAPSSLLTSNITSVSTTGTNTTIVCASNVDFNRMTAGESVNSSASYAPITSTISNVLPSINYTPYFVGEVYAPSNAFNGDLSTFASYGQGGNNRYYPLTYDFTGFYGSNGVVTTQNVEIYTFVQTDSSGGAFTHNVRAAVNREATSSDQVPNLGGAGWYAIPNSVGTIKTLNLQGSYSGGQDKIPQLYAIKINGQILTNQPLTLTFASNQDLTYLKAGDVIQSDWNQDQEWSNNSSFGSANEGVNQPLTAAFDGDLTKGPNSTKGVTWQFTPTGGIPFTNKVEVYYQASLNGTDYTVNNAASGTLPSTPDQWVTVASGGGTLTELSTDRFTGNNAVGFSGIRVDGKVLVDASIPASSNPNSSKILSVDATTKKVTVDGGTWLGSDGSGTVGGDTTVNGPSNSASGKITTITTGTNTLVIGESNSRWVSSGAWNTTTLQGNAASSNFQVEDPNVPGTPLPPDTEPPSAANYTLIETDVDDVTQLTSWTPDADFPSGSSVFVRVKYKDNTSLVSDFSDWSGFDVSSAGQFTPVLYRGNGSSQYIDTVGFAPDLVWVKSRTDSTSHTLVDSVRGAANCLESNSSSAEFNNLASIYSLDSNGFVIGDYGSVNASGQNYVAWCWDAGNSTVANTDGTIASQVRSNGNFSIVSYTGDSTTLKTIGHGLTNAPSFIICKSTDQNDVDWFVYSQPLSPQTYVRLNQTTANQNSGAVWGNTAPTSTVFSVGDSIGTGSANNFIAYCWAETAGGSSFGEYTGNGQDTQEIATGFKPAFAMIKRTDNTGNWLIFDAARNDAAADGKTPYLQPNTSNVEDELGAQCTFTDTGFTVGSWEEVNVSGGTYIYAAFA